MPIGFAAFALASGQDTKSCAGRAAPNRSAAQQWRLVSSPDNPDLAFVESAMGSGLVLDAGQAGAESTRGKYREETSRLFLSPVVSLTEGHGGTRYRFLLQAGRPCACGSGRAPRSLLSCSSRLRSPAATASPSRMRRVLLGWCWRRRMVGERAHGCRCETTAKGPALADWVCRFCCLLQGRTRSRLWAGRRRIAARRSSGGTRGSSRQARPT